MKSLTTRQKKQLVAKVEVFLRRRWDKGFCGNDAKKLMDYCLNEATTADVCKTAIEFDEKYRSVGDERTERTADIAMSTG